MWGNVANFVENVEKSHEKGRRCGQKGEECGNFRELYGECGTLAFLYELNWRTDIA